MSNDLPENYDLLSGVITDYTQIEKAPIIEYDQNSASIIFKNKINPEVGIAASTSNSLNLLRFFLVLL